MWVAKSGDRAVGGDASASSKTATRRVNDQHPSESANVVTQTREAMLL